MISNKISIDPKVQEHIQAILAPLWNMSTASYLYNMGNGASRQGVRTQGVGSLVNLQVSTDSWYSVSITVPLNPKQQVTFCVFCLS